MKKETKPQEKKPLLESYNRLFGKMDSFDRLGIKKARLDEGFDMTGFRDLSLHQQSGELERVFKKKFKTIHFGDIQKVGSVQQFIFIEENDDESVLKSALSYIKSEVSMGGRVGEYEGTPAIILFYA